MARKLNNTKLSKNYVKFCNFVKLTADLIGLYNSETFGNKCKTLAQLISFLHQNDLIQTFLRLQSCEACANYTRHDSVR